MHKKFTKIFIGFLLFIAPLKIFAQQHRIQVIQQRLDSLGFEVPGLNQKVQLHVTGITLQEYLIALSKSNSISISVDPKLSYTINDSFNGVTAANILVLLAQKYNLEINVVGSIIYITAYQDPNQFAKAPAKEIKAKYDQLSNTLTLELHDDSLVAVAKKITEISGKNVVVPIALQTKRVSGYIQKAPFETAMDKLAFSNEIKMIKTSDNYFLFQPLDEDEQLYVNGDNNTAVRRTFKPASPASGHGSNGLLIRNTNGQRLISVNAIDAPIGDLVKQASDQLNKNYSIYSDIKGTITIHVNDIDYDEFLDLLFKGTDYTYHTDNNVYIMGDSKLEGLRAFKVIQLQNRSIDTIVSMLPTEWKKGIEIKEFKEQNTLLLSGSSTKIAEMESYIKQLDVPVPVILIEVTMIDINKNRNVTTGIAAGVSDSAKTGGSILPGLNFTFSTSSINSFLSSLDKITSINLGHVVPNFYVSLNALETLTNSNVRSVPKMTALNGHTATLSIGNSVYYNNTTQNVIPSAATSQTVLTNTYVESDANMTIDLRPVVSGDDQITLGIKINIADFTSIPTSGPPPKSTSKYETSLRVSNGDMILLGGIERTEHDDNVSGFPILSRIPILKYIFSNKSQTNNKVVTVIFIKPTIMR